eukprot:COSAG02_NODE_2221_length_9469_cov_3.478975_1_plen_71_part_00
MDGLLQVNGMVAGREPLGTLSRNNRSAGSAGRRRKAGTTRCDDNLFRQRSRSLSVYEPAHGSRGTRDRIV